MSMENTENLDVKPEENKEQVALDFGNMAPDEIQELKEEPDTTGKCNRNHGRCGGAFV